MFKLSQVCFSLLQLPTTPTSPQRHNDDVKRESPVTSWKPVKREVVARLRGHDDNDVIKVRWSPHAHVIVDTHLRSFARSFDCDVAEGFSSASSVAATSNDESQGEGEVPKTARKRHPCYHGDDLVDDEEDNVRRRRNVKSWCMDSATLSEKFDDVTSEAQNVKCDVTTYVDVEVGSKVKFVAELNDQNFAAFTIDNLRFKFFFNSCFVNT